MKSRFALFALLVVLIPAASEAQTSGATTARGSCFAQSTARKKSYTFHGKVVSVDNGNKTLRIDGEKVEGWMEAMTMNYRTDDPSLVDKVKPGDQISATVYDGDYVLHNVKIAPPKK